MVPFYLITVVINFNEAQTIANIMNKIDVPFYLTEPKQTDFIHDIIHILWLMSQKFLKKLCNSIPTLLVYFDNQEILKANEGSKLDR